MCHLWTQRRKRAHQRKYAEKRPIRYLCSKMGHPQNERRMAECCPCERCKNWIWHQLDCNALFRHTINVCWSYERTVWSWCSQSIGWNCHDSPYRTDRSSQPRVRQQSQCTSVCSCYLIRWRFLQRHCGWTRMGICRRMCPQIWLDSLGITL